MILFLKKWKLFEENLVIKMDNSNNCDTLPMSDHHAIQGKN